MNLTPKKRRKLPFSLYRLGQGIAMREKDCHCHTCNKDFHHLGIARHRAMHRDKNQNCKITFSTGKTYLWNYSKRSNQIAPRVISGVRQGDKMQYLDKHGWPVERVKGRWFQNFIRLLIHTRKIKRGSFITNQPSGRERTYPQQGVEVGTSRNLDGEA